MEDTHPVWKKVYQTLSIDEPDIEPNIIDRSLEICKKKLSSALLEYKFYTKESFKVWSEKSILSPTGEDDIRSFLNVLSIELDLDVNVCWTLIFNYLMFEYYGKVDELKTIIRFETNGVALIEHIFMFYECERMFVLKLMRHIFAKAKDPNHFLYDKFNAFIASLDLDQVWKDLNSTFDLLFNEITKAKIQLTPQRNIDLKRWSSRNNREQCELVLLIIEMLPFYEVKADDFKETLRRFMRHNFGKTALYGPVRLTFIDSDIEEIQHAEMGCLLVMAHKLTQKSDLFAPLTEEVESCLISDVNSADYAMVLFIWSVLKGHFENSEIFLKDNLLRILSSQEQQKIFEFIHSVLNSYVFTCNSLAKYVHEAANSIFQLLFDHISLETKALLMQEEKFPHILASLIKHRVIPFERHFADCLEIAFKLFPYLIAPLTCILKEMVKIPEYYLRTIELISNFKTAMIKRVWEFPHGPWTFNAERDFELFPGCDGIIVREGSKLERFAFEQYIATFVHVEYTFYEMINDLMRLLVLRMQRGAGVYDEQLANDLVLAYEVIIEIIKNHPGDLTKDEALLKCASQVDFFLQFTGEEFHSTDLVLTYLRVKAALLKSDKIYLHEIISPILQKQFLPSMAEDRIPSKQVHLYEIKTNCILHKCIMDEEITDDHSLLYEYMQLILYAFENNKYQQELQKPGLVYTTYIVFPHYAQWRYKNLHQRYLIIKTYYKMLICVLGKHPKDYPDVDSEQFNKYLSLFINEEWTQNCFVNYFTRQKFYLNSLMEEDVNWGANGRAATKIEVIKLQLTLLILFTKNKLIVDPRKEFVFDKHVSHYCKAITPFMVAAYDTSLAVLSIQFLNVLANDINAPVMALLGLDYDQAQRIFLERIRDTMENEKIKVHILELISTCVIHQHGLTAAVFNVEWSKKWYDPYKHKIPSNDSMSNFIEDYFTNLETSTAFLQNRQQILILKVMCNVWVAQKQKLLSNVTICDWFWKGLMAPFQDESIYPVEVYLYILRLVNIQFLRPSKECPDFPVVMKKFINNKQQIAHFTDFLCSLFTKKTEDVDEMKLNCSLLIHWSEFLIASNNFDKSFYENDDIKYFLINVPLKAIDSIVESDHLPHWIDLLFVVMSNWEYKYIGTEKEFSESIKKFLRIVFKVYQYYPGRLRDSVLAIIKRTIKDLKPYYEEAIWDLQELLEIFGPLMDFEYKQLEQFDWKFLANNPSENTEMLVPWMLVVHTLNEVLSMKSVNEFTIWFKYHDYLERLFEIVPKLICCSSTMRLAKIGIYSMTLYMKTSMAFDVGNLSIIRFYDLIEPPLRQIVESNQLKRHPMRLKELYITLSVLMRFNQTIIKQFKMFTIKDVLSFLFLNEFIINYIIILPQYTTDINALDLLIVTLCFIDDVLLHAAEEWYKKSHMTFFNTLSGIKTVINSCITAILRPKKLTFYELDESGHCVQTAVPADILAIVANKLITIISVACSCLYKINADYVSLLYPTMPSDIIFIMVDTDFNVPKFDQTITENLTYSRLLCLAHFLCKTLTQLQLQSDSQLSIHKDDDITRYIGLIEHCSPEEMTQNEKLSTFLRYGLYEYSGLTDPWIKKMDLKTVKCGLEMLFVFLSVQVYLTIGTSPKSSFQRSLLSELQFLHDFVKKTAHEYLGTHPDFNKPHTDILVNFKVCLKKNGEFEKLADEYFLTLLSQWFTNICRLNELAMFY